MKNICFGNTKSTVYCHLTQLL